MTKILSIYDEVKKIYFPDWDRNNQWRVELKETLTDGWLAANQCNKVDTEHVE